MLRILPAIVLAVLAPSLAAAAGPLTVTTQVMVEQRVSARDGTTRTRLTPAAHAVPGDRLIVAVTYRNTGTTPIANLVITNPVPKGLVYRGAASAPAPEVSADGQRFAPLGTLAIGGRPASPAEITHVRWRVTDAVAPGTGSQFSFQAVLK